MTAHSRRAAEAALVAELRRGRSLALYCTCSGPCHCDVAAERLVRAVHGVPRTAAHREAQRLVDVVRDPEPPAAYGLDLEAAKPHKWHCGVSLVWIGWGFSSAALVFWVPLEKRARALHFLFRILDLTGEEEEVVAGEYQSEHGFLVSLTAMTGGGQYRNKGLARPMRPGG